MSIMTFLVWALMWMVGAEHNYAVEGVVYGNWYLPNVSLGKQPISSVTTEY